MRLIEVPLCFIFYKYSTMASKNDNVMDNKYSRPQRRWLMGLIIATVVLGLFGGLLGWHYRTHLLWKYYVSRGVFPTVQTIPHSDMHEVDIPEDWIECSLGCLRFSLPPDLVILEDTARRTENLAGYYDEFRQIAVIIPAPIDNGVDPLSELVSHFVANHENTLTSPRVYLELCKFSTSDFCWSMSRQDVLRLSVFSIIHAAQCMEMYETAETFFHDNVDRIVFFSDRVSIYWQATTAPHQGTVDIKFRGNRYGNNDQDLLARRICQSIRIVCTCSLDTDSIEHVSLP